MKRLINSSTFVLIFSLSMIPLMVSCKGDQGPAGPTGPQGVAGPQGLPGPSYILAFGSVTPTGSVASIGPPAVLASVSQPATGTYTVTPTLPTTVSTVEPPSIVVSSVSPVLGGIISTYADGDLECYGGVYVGGTCGSNQILFDVRTRDGSGTAVNEGFSFVVLSDQ